MTVPGASSLERVRETCKEVDFSLGPRATPRIDPLGILGGIVRTAAREYVESRIGVGHGKHDRV